MNSRTAVVGLILAAGMILTPSLSASAIPDSSHSVRKEFRNCTELNKTYKHGVGKSGAKDKVSGSAKPVTNFKVSTTVYHQNKKSDRDKDGVACEKK
jgi:hypothetical protein